MAETAEKLSAVLEKEKQKTISFFRDLPEDVWQKKLYADGAEWTVYEVLVHIVEVEGSLTKLFEHVARGGNGVGEDFDIDAHNKEAVSGMAGASKDALLDEFSALRDTLIENVSGWTEDQFQNVGRHPFLGEARLEEMIRLFYLHVNLHTRDIRKMAKG